MNIEKFTKGLAPTIEVSAIFEDLATLKKALELEVLPPFVTAETVYPDTYKFRSNPVEAFQYQFDKHVRLKRSGNWVSVVRGVLVNTRDLLTFLEKAADVEFANQTEIATASITYRQSTVLQLMSLCKFLLHHSSMELLWTFGEEIQAYLTDRPTVDEPYSKGEEKDLERNWPSYFNTVQLFGTLPRQFASLLEGIPDIQVADTAAAVVGRGKTDPLRLGLFNDSYWNPLYAIFQFRLQRVNKQVAQYQELQETRQSLELRILQQKQAQDGVADPSVEKSIDFMETQLQKTRAKIENMEVKFG